MSGRISSPATACRGISTAGRGEPRHRATGIVGQLPRFGGGLQDCPLWGVRPRRWRARLPVLERLVEGGRLRGDGRADDEVPGGRGGWDVRRGRGANPPIVRGQPVSPPRDFLGYRPDSCGNTR